MGKILVENSSFRFSQAAVLNDPYELNPSLEVFSESIRNHVKNSKTSLDNTASMSPKDKEASLNRIVQPSLDEVKTLTQNNLVLSLTKKEDNFLMWSHYADSHRGIVIGFDFDNPFFHQVSHPQITSSRDVIYTNRRPEFFDFDNFWNWSASPDAYRDMLLTKSLNWQNEDEVRMIASPLAGKCVGKDENGFDIYVFSFPKECLRKILFGSSIKASERDEVMKIATKIYPHVEFFEAVVKAAGFDLEIRPFTP